MSVLDKIKTNRNLQVLLLLIILCAVIRFAFIGTPSIRGDEGGSIFIAKQGFSTIIKNLKGDVHPPLYYLALSFWAKLGESEFFLRSLSTIFSIFSIPFLYLIGKKLFSEKTGLFASAIFAFSQFHLRYAQTLRSYSMATFFILLSTYFFISYLQENKLKNLISYVFVSALCLYTHYYTAFVLVAQNLYFFLNFKRHKPIIRKWVLSQLGVFLLFLPWLPMLYTQIFHPVPGGYGYYSTPLSLFSLNMDNLFLRLAMMLFHMSVGYLKSSFTSFFFLSFFGISIGAFLLSLSSSARNFKSRNGSLIFALFTVPVIIMLTLWYTGLVHQLLYARYLIFVSPFFYLIIANGIDTLSFPKFFSRFNWKIALLVIILLLNLVSMYPYFKYDKERGNIRDAALVVKDNAESSDIVILNSPTLAFHYKYYLGYDYPLWFFPSGLDATNINQLSVTKTHQAIEPLTEENACNVLDLTHGQSTWFICSANPYGEDLGECPLVRKCFENAGYTVEKELVTSWQDIYGARITEYAVYYFKK